MPTTLLLGVLLQSAPRVDWTVAVDLQLRADRAMRAGEWAAAVELCTQALAASDASSATLATRATLAYSLACAHARAGATDAAFASLEDAIRAGYADRAFAAWDPDLASVREDPRFASVLQRMGRSDPASASSRDVPSARWPGSVLVSLCSAELAPSGAWAVAGDRYGEMCELTVGRATPAWSFDAFGAPVRGLAISPDESHVAAVAGDGALLVWSRERDCVAWRARVDSREERDERVRDLVPLLSWAPDGSVLLAAAWDRGATLWSRDGAVLHAWEGDVDHFFVASASWSSDGSTLATIEAERIVLRSARTGEVRDTIGAASSPARSVAFFPDGRIASGHEDGFARIWRPPEHRPRIEVQHVDPLFRCPTRVSTVSPSPGGRWLATSTTEGVHVRVLDASTGNVLWTSDYLGSAWGTAGLRWTDDSRFLWWPSTDGDPARRIDAFELDAARDGDESGRSPETGYGVALALDWPDEIALVEVPGGRLRGAWKRLYYGWLAYSADGHVAAEGWKVIEELVDLLRICGRETQREWVLGHVDPKRVRAALVGTWPASR